MADTILSKEPPSPRYEALAPSKGPGTKNSSSIKIRKNMKKTLDKKVFF